ncbi:hypothetical protein [Oceanobacillus picturae]|uniref:hypothetical protein n=1 Tax=Oceanobacillus picturae TaxID=171693 RepID=UPI0036305D79
MIRLRKKQNKKARKKLIDRKWYSDWSTHFGYISGLLTIIGLVYGVISYHQTVKPLVDEKKLSEQIAELEVQNNDINDENLFLSETKTNLNKELLKLELKKENLENELQSKEGQLLKLQDEVHMANADAYMTPIIYEFLYSSVFSGENEKSVKKETLEELSKLSNDTSITVSQRSTLNTLINFVNEKLNQNSNYDDLLDYRVYIYDQKLKEMGIGGGE